jgi:hypothetical protein
MVTLTLATGNERTERGVAALVMTTPTKKARETKTSVGVMTVTAAREALPATRVAQIALPIPRCAPRKTDRQGLSTEHILLVSMTPWIGP